MQNLETVAEDATKDFESDIKRAAKSLLGEMESLAQRLTQQADYLAKWLETGDLKAWNNLNTLGEVQGSGASIDNKIGNLHGMRHGLFYLTHTLDQLSEKE